MGISFPRALIAAAAVCLAPPTASAQSFTYSTFTLTPVGDTFSFFNMGSLTPQPTTGTVFNSYSVTVNWSALANDPWSNEAGLGLSTNGTSTGPAYAFPRFATGGAAGNGNPTTLTFSGFLDSNYTGGSPLFLNAIQTFPTSTANWANITVQLTNNTPPTPPASTLVGNNSTTDFPVLGGEIRWARIDYAGGDVQIDTNASLPATLDTEIALYSSNGTLLATSDDDGNDLLSLIAIANGELQPGTYYIAMGLFDTVFDEGFVATTDSLDTATITLTVTTTPIPEPATVGLVGAIAAVGLRRLVRRRG
jgi:hypothetical protein